MADQQGLFREADGAPAAVAAPPSTAAPAAAAPAQTVPTFAWKDAGLEPLNAVLVEDRGWKGINDSITSYRNLEKLTGVPPAQLVKLPKDASDPTAWRDVHTKMGCPEKPEGYTLPTWKGDQGFAKLVTPWMHEAGLSQAAATTLTTRFSEFRASQEKAAGEQREITQKQESEFLRSPGQWGDKFDSNSAIVDRAGEAFGMTSEQLGALKTVMGYAGAMKFLYNIGSKVAVEGTGLIGGGGATFSGMAPDTARAEINRLTHDKNWAAQFNSNDPRQRQEAREKMARLSQAAYPGSTPV